MGLRHPVSNATYFFFSVLVLSREKGQKEPKKIPQKVWARRLYGRVDVTKEVEGQRTTKETTRKISQQRLRVRGSL